MHDLGKFLDRHVLDIDDEKATFFKETFLPEENGKHSYWHALYTAAFIDKYRAFIPTTIIENEDQNNDESLIFLAAGHHKEFPDSLIMQSIITAADRISSGMARETSAEHIDYSEFKKTRLLSVFERLSKDGGKIFRSRNDFDYCLPLTPLTPASIFPGRRTELEPSEKIKANSEYEKHARSFLNDFKRLRHRKENPALWLEQFDSLLLKYTSSIPSARAGKIIPDDSLYDHVRTTAAIAAALYLFMTDQKGTMGKKGTSEDMEKSLLLVSGDFYGIQKFIFSGHSDTGKFRSKILRGRSFMVSLFIELAADLVCSKIGLTPLSSILNAAGKFTIIAPNTEKSKNAIIESESTINDWLMRNTYGQNSLGLSFVEASSSDFQIKNFSNLWGMLGEKIADRKSMKFSIEKYGGSVTSYLDEIPAKEKQLCPLCKQRPTRASEKYSATSFDDDSNCAICHDQIFIGASIVKNKRLAVLKPTNAGGTVSGDLLEPIFGKYQLKFTDENLQEAALSGELIRIWALGFEDYEKSPDGIATRLFKGYVPLFSESDENDIRLKNTIEEDSKPGDILTFSLKFPAI